MLNLVLKWQQTLITALHMPQRIKQPYGHLGRFFFLWVIKLRWKHLPGLPQSFSELFLTYVNLIFKMFLKEVPHQGCIYFYLECSQNSHWHQLLKYSRMGRQLELTTSMLRCLKQSSPHLPECSLTYSRISERKTSSSKTGPKASSSSFQRKANCDNWWGITLLSIPSKVFYRILLTTIEVAIDIRLRQEQAGFRKERGCVNQIFFFFFCPKKHHWAGVECSLISQLHWPSTAYTPWQLMEDPAYVRNPSDDGYTDWTILLAVWVYCHPRWHLSGL